jgi:hypothetical protein
MAGTKSSTIFADGSAHPRTAVDNARTHARHASGPGSRGPRRHRAPRPAVPVPIAPRPANAQVVGSAAAHAIARASPLEVALLGPNARRAANPAPRGAAARPNNQLGGGPADFPYYANPPPNIAPLPAQPLLQGAQLPRPHQGPLDMHGQPANVTELQQRLIQQERYNYNRNEELDRQEAYLRIRAQLLDRQEADQRAQAQLFQHQEAQVRLHRTYTVEEHQRLMGQACAEAEQRGRAEVYRGMMVAGGHGGMQLDRGEGIGAPKKELKEKIKDEIKDEMEEE